MRAPHLGTLPLPQRLLFDELGSTPSDFILYGGTALALHLGHRVSVDFYFFSNVSFDPEALARRIPYLRGAERVQVDVDTLTCRVERGGPVLVSFFGGLGLQHIALPHAWGTPPVHVAAMLDIAGAKAAVVQKRAEEKDYIDIDALIQTGHIDLPTILAAGSVVYGEQFNPLITLKALSYFSDVPRLPAPVRERLAREVSRVDVTHLPTLQPLLDTRP